MKTLFHCQDMQMCDCGVTPTAQVIVREGKMFASTLLHGR